MQDLHAMPGTAGTLDASFDGDGKQTVNFGGSDVGYAVSVDGSGRIVVAGFASSGSGEDFAVARLLADAAAPAPVVATLPVLAASVTAQGATLRMTLNANGSAANWYFRYGTAPGVYTDSTAATAAPGTTNTGRTSAVTGLLPGTLYYVQAVATSVGGRAVGDNVTFTTLLASPTVVTAAATLVTSTTATFNGTLNPRGTSTTYRFVYGTDAELDSGAELTTSVQGPVSGTDDVAAVQAMTGLAAGTVYYARLSATNGGGTTLGAIVTFTTDVAGATGLSVAGLISLEPTFAWRRVTAATGYAVQVDDDSNLDADAADLTPPIVRPTALDTLYAVDYDALRLGNATGYFWRVVTTGTNGVDVPSATTSITTTPATILPRLNYPIEGAVADPRALTFGWSPYTRDTRYTYRLQVDVVPQGGSPDWADLILDVDTGTAIEYPTTSLAGSTTFAWRVITYDTKLDDSNAFVGTTMSYTAPITFSTRTGAVAAIPSYPTGGVTVNTVTPKLSWYLSASATGLTYDVQYRNATDNAAYPGAPQATRLTAREFTTPALVGGKSYGWQVRTCAGTTCSDWSAEASFAVTGGAATATPVQPVLSYPIGNVTVYSSPVSLSWSAPSAPAGLTYVAYTYVCSTPLCTDAPAITAANTGYTASAPQAASTYALSVAPGTRIAWYVRSFNGNGEASAASTAGLFVMNAATSSTATAVISWPKGGAEMATLTPSLSWWVSGAGVTGFEVCFGTAAAAGDNAGCASPALRTATQTGYTIPGGQLAWGTTYYWFVRPVGASTWSSASFKTTGAAGTLTPTVSWPTNDATVWGTSTTLSWYVNGASAAIASYEVEVTRLGSGGATTTTTVAAPTRTLALTGLLPGVSYTWRVRSHNGTDFSSFSTTGTFTMNGVAAAIVPVAASPAAGVLVTGAPMLAWALPAAPDGALVYEVEVAQQASMDGAKRYSGLATPYVALTSLPAGTHYWRVRSRSSAGTSDFSDVETFVTQQATASEAVARPTAFAFEAVYPNPMHGRGQVRFALPDAAPVRVTLFDALGRVQAVLLDGDRPAGVHVATVEGATLAPGVYVVRVQAGAHQQTRTFVVR